MWFICEISEIEGVICESYFAVDEKGEYFTGTPYAKNVVAFDTEKDAKKAIKSGRYLSVSKHAYPREF